MAKKPSAPKKTAAPAAPKRNGADKADTALKTFISSVDHGIQMATGETLEGTAERMRLEGRTGSLVNIVICAAADAQKQL